MRIQVLSLCLILAGLAAAQERKITRSQLPVAIANATARLSREGTMRGFSEEKENGQIYYEIEMTVDGHSKDVLLDSSGTVVEVEEQLPIESLPAGVRDALQAKAGKGKMVKVESIRKHDRLVAYEAQVTHDGRKSEVQVGPDGKALDHEE